MQCAARRFGYLVLGLLLSGCGHTTPPANPRPAAKPQAVAKGPAAKPQTVAKGPAAESVPLPQVGEGARGRSETAAEVTQSPPPIPTPGDPKPSLPAQPPPESAAAFVDRLPRLPIDDARVAAAGIRKLVGNRLTLYTDLPTSEEIERLPEIFAQAFPQWCEYFHIDPAASADWNMTAFLMHDKTRFQRAGVVPERLPPFLHGYTWNHELWLYEQPSDYYRRHLLLHEGTHGFMFTRLGSCGPPWYMEGIAELLATHRWQNGRLTLNYLPASREEVPEWGRIRIVKDALKANRGKSLKDVIAYKPTPQQETEPYGWCWAIATLLDRHPRYQARFRTLYQYVRQRDFNERFLRLFANDWQELCEDWQVFTAGLQYGYDFAHTTIDFTPGKPLPDGGRAVVIAADHGWQNSGWRLAEGIAYRLRAQGRYQVGAGPLKRSMDGTDKTLGGTDKTLGGTERTPGGTERTPGGTERTLGGTERTLGGTDSYAIGVPQAQEALRNGPAAPNLPIWFSEPNGISIRYYQGRPLGLLLAAVRPDPPERRPADGSNTVSAFLQPIEIGLSATLTPQQAGTLFLKINASAAELSGNAGALKVEIERQ